MLAVVWRSDVAVMAFLQQDLSRFGIFMSVHWMISKLGLRIWVTRCKRCGHAHVKTSFPLNSAQAMSLPLIEELVSGRLECKRGVAQTRTLPKIHSDQYWVNARNKDSFYWIVRGKVQFLGQDDKAKILLNMIAVGSNILSSCKTIAGELDSLQAADHNFSFWNITPSVTIICNKPDDVGGSFFSGGEPENGETFVTLKVASNVFSRTANHSFWRKKKWIHLFLPYKRMMVLITI